LIEGMGNEIPLRGGRVTAGVVRVGDTVRRPPQPNAAFVHALLEHLVTVGFDGAPRFLGQDEQGRDIFSFIEGAVPADLAWHDDDVLVAAAQLIRRFHDATVALAATMHVGADRPEVVCHNDLSPCNFVFRAGMPVAIIDFDLTAPGMRHMDVGYAAWGWLDRGNREIAAAEQQRRLALFVAAYGGLDATTVKDAILLRQQLLAADGEIKGKIEMTQWARACRDWCARNL
jgi:Phosphotransferase enzyme family